MPKKMVTVSSEHNAVQSWNIKQYITSTFRVKEQAKKETRVKLGALYTMLSHRRSKNPSKWWKNKCRNISTHVKNISLSSSLARQPFVSPGLPCTKQLVR
jgi:hypothetical protein